MAENGEKRKVRDQLILEGIRELNEYGYQDFSVRRIAATCQLSCAAPYKHFKDKHSFVAAIVEYIGEQWRQRQEALVQRFPGSTRRQLVEISVDYVRFLVENPYFRSTIMLRDDDFDKEFARPKGRLSPLAGELVIRYCAEAGMPEDVRHFKLYVVRSLIYGAALMFDNGEMAYTEENLRLVWEAIDREFTIPHGGWTPGK